MQAIMPPQSYIIQVQLSLKFTLRVLGFYVKHVQGKLMISDEYVMGKH